MRTVLEEIEDAILEEQEAELKAAEQFKQEVKTTEDYPAYLKNNIVTMPLIDYLSLYESNKELSTHLTALVDLIINSTELTIDKAELRIEYFNCSELMKYVKEIDPLAYVERYETLLEEADRKEVKEEVGE